MFDDYDKSSAREWPQGLGFSFLLHICQAILGPLTNWYSLQYIGLGQLLYIVPAIWWCRRNKQDDFAKGLIIGAALTFLLNASCTAMFWNFP
jgi:hypothetical protein